MASFQPHLLPSTPSPESSVLGALRASPRFLIRTPDMYLQDFPGWPLLASQSRHTLFLSLPSVLTLHDFFHLFCASFSSCPPPSMGHSTWHIRGQSHYLQCCPQASSPPPLVGATCQLSHGPRHPVGLSPLTPQMRIWQTQRLFPDSLSEIETSGSQPAELPPSHLQTPNFIVFLPRLLLCFPLSQVPGWAE